MSEPDITKEVWTVASTSPDDLADQAPYIFRLVRKGSTEGELIAKVLDAQGSRARADMLARGPTLFRILEQILNVCEVPADLREIAEINLYLAAPGHRPKPPVGPKVERKSAWEKLLDEDL